MTPSVDDYYVHALRSADGDGRAPLSRVTAWEIFPFERDGLRVVPLRPPQLPEPARRGEDGTDCPSCTEPTGVVWRNDRWRLVTFAETSGAPLVLMLQSVAHRDLIDLDDAMAEEFGRLVVHVARSIESLEHVARAHVSRWGDGNAHVHVFFLARPAGFTQLRGTCFALWDDLLEPVPREQRDHDAREVIARLVASVGGDAL